MSIRVVQSSAVGVTVLQAEEGDAPIIVTIEKLVGAEVELVAERADVTADDLIVNESSVSLT